MREAENRLHSESMSIGQVGVVGKASGVRVHSTGETPGEGRSGGG